MKHLKMMVMLTVIVALFGLGGCKKAAEAVKQFVLTITRGAGVSGEPNSGSVTYDENATVTYNYTADSGYKSLTVILDGQVVGTSGTITMNQNHTLQATTEQIMYMEGTWDCDLVWKSGDCNVDDCHDFMGTGTRDGGNFRLEFKNVPVGEATMDINLTGPIDNAGNFSMTGTSTVKWEGLTYIFEFSGSGKMNGENSFTSSVDLKITQGNNTCTKKGTLSGTKN